MKIGVIGAGYWGPNIIRNLLAPDQEVIIYDINLSHIQSALQRFEKCRSVNSLEDILHDPDIHSVVIAVPLRLHYQLIIKSLLAGKHVFVEKSLCYSCGEADKIQFHLNGKTKKIGGKKNC